MSEATPLPFVQGGKPVRWYIRVTTSSIGEGTLYYRDVWMTFLPSPEDRVHLGYNWEDHEDSFGWDVKKRYWSFDGSAALEMYRIRVDPKDWNPHTDGKYEKSWSTAVDGDPHEFLLANEWKVYT